MEEVLISFGIAIAIVAVIVIIIAVFSGSITDKPSSKTKDYVPTFLSSNDEVGKRGETYVTNQIAAFTSLDDYVLANLLVPTKYRTQEIDTVIVSTKGVFVIETKTWKGTIKGKASEDQWTQILGRGDIIHQHRNPLMQNETHCNAIKWELHKKYNIHNIVIMLNAEEIDTDSTNVFTLTQFRKYYESLSRKELTQEEAKSIKQLLLKFTVYSKEQLEKHVRNIQENRKE